LSSYKEGVGTKVSVTGLTGVGVEPNQWYPGKYVAAVYSDWYLRHIIAHNNEECDLVKFMKRKG
jgi:hypothetical protein